MDDPSAWRWIWIGAAVAFAIGEMTTAGSLFLLPFAVGAAGAAVLAFLDVGVGWEWGVFVGVSLAAFAGLRPVAKRLDKEAPLQRVGASRWVGQVGVALTAIPGEPAASGSVRVDREEWRAESHTGSEIPAGTRVRVVNVAGTRLVVEPWTEAAAGPETGEGEG